MRNILYKFSLRRNILYTDESSVELYPAVNSNDSVFRGPANEKPFCPRVTRSPKIIVAAGFNGLRKTPLHIVPQGQTVNSRYYNENILPIYYDYLLNEESSTQESFVHSSTMEHLHTGRVSLGKTLLISSTLMTTLICESSSVHFGREIHLT